MRRIVLLICMILLLSGGVRAYAEGFTQDAFEAVGASKLEEKLSDAQQEVTGNLTLDGSYDTGGALRRLWERLKDELLAQFHEQFVFALRLAALPLLCALADALTDSKAARDLISLTACCAAALWLAGDWDSGISQAAQTLEQLSDYSRAAMPVVYTAAAAAGAMGSAPLKYAASCLAIEVMMTLSRRLVLPLIYSYLALSLCGCICENSLVKALGRLVKFAAVTIMSGATTLFCMYVGFTGLVAGSADAAAVKAARTVISGVLPVVGGILSDSAASLLAAAGVVRSTAGVFALIALCALCAGPFAFLLMKMLFLRAVGTMAELLPGGKLSSFLEEIATVFALLLGLLGSSGVMLFFSLMSGMKAVTGA